MKKFLAFAFFMVFLVAFNSCNWFNEQVDELKGMANKEESAEEVYDYEQGSEDYDLEEDVEDSPIQTKGDYSRMFHELVMPEKGGVFRGIYFDESYETVFYTEEGYSTSEIYEENEDEFTITSDMGEEVLDFADITYYFDEAGLYEIFADIYNNSEIREARVYDDLVSYFESTLGEGNLAEDGFIEFTGTDKESGNGYLVAFQRLDYDSGLELYVSVE